MRTLVASVLASLMVLVLAANPASAQKKKAKKDDAGGGDAAGQKVKNYDFSADNIEGELIKPDGEMVNARKFAEHTSLIRVRTDFIKEIVKSADNL